MKTKPDYIVLHSSFFNHLTIFNYALKLLKLTNKEAKIYLDVRDRGLLQRYAYIEDDIEGLIACSDNVVEFLLACGFSEKKIHHIPVVFELPVIDVAGCKQVSNCYDFEEKRYVFYAGLIKKSKRVFEVIEGFRVFNSSNGLKYKLVLAGLVKEPEEMLAKYRILEDVLFVGNLQERELHCLMSKALICVNISRVEGMPRTSLEALACCEKVVLPPNVPEFKRSSPDNVYDGDSSEELAFIINKLVNSSAPASYCLESHFVDKVISQYIELLK